MGVRDLSLFSGGARLQMTESIELTIQSMQAYGPEHDHWVFAWSGGNPMLHRTIPRRFPVLASETETF